MKRYIALGLWVVVAGLFLSVASQWIRFNSSDKQLTQYTQSLVQRATLERRPALDVRTLLVAKANELEVPSNIGVISVSGQGETLRTIISYEKEIRMPLLNRVVYRLEFNHTFNN